MDELLQQLIGRLRGMWHRRWIGLAIAWIVGIVAIGVAMWIPERYEASAGVYSTGVANAAPSNSPPRKDAGRADRLTTVPLRRIRSTSLR